MINLKGLSIGVFFITVVVVTLMHSNAWLQKAGVNTLFTIHFRNLVYYFNKFMLLISLFAKGSPAVAQQAFLKVQIRPALKEKP
jgi:hypothetical protein